MGSPSSLFRCLVLAASVIFSSCWSLRRRVVTSNRHLIRMLATPTDMAASRGSEGDKHVTLLLATAEDKASLNILQNLLSKGGWRSEAEVDGGAVWAREAREDIRLWRINEGFLRADHLDEIWEAATQSTVEGMIFLSRHAAKSGRPSVTVHSIGNPGVEAASDADEPLPHGGRAGRCVPPHPLKASLFRLLHGLNSESGRLKDYEITLETTHHGPWVSRPSVFVEIGSCEEHWGREEAGRVWADVLEKGLGLTAAEPSAARGTDEAVEGSGVVVVGLGGGHYAPRFNDLLRHRADVFIGHCLASYSLSFDSDRWQGAVREAIDATKAAHPGREVYVYYDKKAFKGTQRQALTAYLSELGVPHTCKEEEIPQPA